MRILTTDVPPSTVPLQGGDRISSLTQIEDICDEVVKRSESKQATEAKAAWARLGKPRDEFGALYSDAARESGVVAGYRVVTVSMTRDVLNDLQAANPSSPEIPPLTVNMLRNNIAMGIAQVGKDVVSAVQGNGQWFLWNVNKIRDAVQTVQVHQRGTAVDVAEGVAAQRVVAPGSSMEQAGEMALNDTVIPQRRNILRYDLQFIDITGRTDVDHNQRPVSKGPQVDAGAAAIEKLAAVLAGKGATDSEPVADEKIHHKTRERLAREAREEMLASLSPELRKQIEAAVAAKK